jgi:hypothetical protein
MLSDNQYKIVKVSFVALTGINFILTSQLITGYSKMEYQLNQSIQDNQTAIQSMYSTIDTLKPGYQEYHNQTGEFE